MREEGSTAHSLSFDIAKTTIAVSNGLAKAARTISNSFHAISSFLKANRPDFLISELTDGH